MTRTATANKTATTAKEAVEFTTLFTQEATHFDKANYVVEVAQPEDGKPMVLVSRQTIRDNGEPGFRKAVSLPLDEDALGELANQIDAAREYIAANKSALAAAVRKADSAAAAAKQQREAKKAEREAKKADAAPIHKDATPAKPQPRRTVNTPPKAAAPAAAPKEAAKAPATGRTGRVASTPTKPAEAPKAAPTTGRMNRRPVDLQLYQFD